MRGSHVFPLSLLILLAALDLAACSNPSPTVPAVPIVSTAPLPTVVKVTIAGLPTTVAYQQSVQLTATVTLADGTQQQRLDATWQSSDTTVATVSPTGILTMIGFGAADVTATFQNVRASGHVTLPKPPPPLARLTVTLNSRGTAALAGASEVVFDFSASTGFGLRYDIAFGDGLSSSSATPSAKHVYDYKSVGVGPGQARLYPVSATVTDMFGRSETATATVPVVHLGNGGYGGWDLNGNGWEVIDFLTQDGPKLTGTYTRPPYPGSTSTTVSPMTGLLSVGGDIHLVLADGTIAFDGPVTANVSEYDRHLLLTVHGGPDDGKTLDFRFVDGE